MKENEKKNNTKATNPANNGCMDWDDVINDDGAEFLMLPEGDYLFHVVDFERKRHEASAKLPACNQATLTLEIKTADGIARAWCDLFLHLSMEWKISAFFRSIGLKQKGTDVKMDWSKVIGAWGRAHFRPTTFPGKDGQEYQKNELTRFLEYDPDLVKPGYTDVTGDVEVPY